MAKAKEPKADKKDKPPAKTRAQREAEKQALALWALLANDGSGFGSKMKPEIEKAEREALRAAGLITVETRERRCLWLEVTDRGWRWAEDHLDSPLPDKTFAGAFVLHAWLTRLKAFMQARNIGLADVLNPRHPVGEHSTTIDSSERIHSANPTALRDRIRSAYLNITGGSFNARALLSDIREQLPDVPRDLLDHALKQMQADEEASLMQLDNRAEISEADRVAAIHIGREPRHILWISQ